MPGQRATPQWISPGGTCSQLGVATDLLQQMQSPLPLALLFASADDLGQSRKLAFGKNFEDAAGLRYLNQSIWPLSYQGKGHWTKTREQTNIGMIVPVPFMLLPQPQPVFSSNPEGKSAFRSPLGLGWTKERRWNKWDPSTQVPPAQRVTAMRPSDCCQASRTEKESRKQTQFRSMIDLKSVSGCFFLELNLRPQYEDLSHMSGQNLIYIYICGYIHNYLCV